MRTLIFPLLLAVVILTTFSSCKDDCEKDHTGTVVVNIADDACGLTYDIYIAGIKEASSIAGSSTSMSGIPWGTRQVQIKVGDVVYAEQSISVFTCNTTTVDFDCVCCPSDLRYKKNITPFVYNAEDFMRIGSYVYEYRTDEFAGLQEGIRTGFLAQELLEVYPHLVKANKEGFYSVNYIEMVPILTKALQEQQQQINELQKELNALKASVKHDL
jgi:hypothetical protein